MLPGVTATRREPGFSLRSSGSLVLALALLPR